MTRAATLVAVLTADVIGSSDYGPSDRKKLDRIIRSAFVDIQRRFPGALHTPMAFRITAGDEFQCVLSDVPRAFEVLTYARAVVAAGGLRPLVRFRASVGVGSLSTLKRASPYEEDGLAFVHARRGLEDLTKSRSPIRWTKLVTGTQEVDDTVDAVLCLADYIQQSWTMPQWEAIRWSLLGLTRKAVARRLRIAHQNVTKRLLAAGWPNFEVGATFLTQSLQKIAGTSKKVQNRDAP